MSRVPATHAVSVVLARSARQQVVTLAVPPGCTARQAVALARAAGLDTGDDIDPARVPIGIHGERVEDTRVLGEGDRVELYRPLRQDPRERRRRRAAEGADGGARVGPGRGARRRRG